LQALLEDRGASKSLQPLIDCMNQQLQRCKWQELGDSGMPLLRLIKVSQSAGLEDAVSATPQVLSMCWVIILEEKECWPVNRQLIMRLKSTGTI
jgi:hypothetical protein